MFTLLQQAVLIVIYLIGKILIQIGDAILFVAHLLFVLFQKALQLPKNLIPKGSIFPRRRSTLQNRGIIFVAYNRYKKRHVSVRAKKLKKEKPKIPYFSSLLLKLKFFAFGAFFSFLLLFLPLVLVMFLQDLPNPRILSQRQIPQTTKLYDRNNILLYEIYASENRTLVPLTRIPQHLINATIAIEDRQFYNHKGIDLLGIVRAARETIVNKNLQGGSTITQQLIKSSLLTPEVSLGRKAKEVVLAMWTERVYTKEDILQMYFNQVPYGGTAWGVEAASEIYFGKRVEDLDLAESAFLAGLPAAPSIYSPFSSTPSLWKGRQMEVLRRMKEIGFIKDPEYKEAEEEELVFKTPRTPILAPHFVMYLKDLLINRYGIDLVEKGGLTVTTTLDLSIQSEVEKMVKEEVNAAANLLVTNGAALVTNPSTGEILAMVGSVDYYNEGRDGNVNATTSLRQPGSSIKVVTYAAALQKGFTAASILDDSPVTYKDPSGAPPYTPVNYDGRFRGRVPLRFALGNSLNIPAVKTLGTVGIDTMVQLAKKMGITSWGDGKQYGLSITLGGAEVKMIDMAKVYGTLANGGIRKDVTPILKITNYKGEVVESLSQFDSGERVLPETVTFILSDILADNKAREMEFGSNSPLKIDQAKVSVKTGTSDNKRDNWTIGYTKDVVVTTWVGNFNNSPMHQSLASGITGAAPMWRRIMLYLLSQESIVKSEPTKTPQDVVAVSCQGRTEYFIKGTEKNAPCRFNPLATQSASLIQTSN